MIKWFSIKWVMIFMIAITPVTALAKPSLNESQILKKLTVFEGDKPLQFLKRFHQNTPALSFIEYTPEGQSLDDWEDMVSIYHYKKHTSAKDFARMMGYTVDNSEGFILNAMVEDEKDPNSVNVIFMSFEMSQERGQVFEFNVWRYTEYQGGIFGFQYAKRHYGQEGIEDFLKATQGDANFVKAKALILQSLSPDLFGYQP